MSETEKNKSLFDHLHSFAAVRSVDDTNPEVMQVKGIPTVGLKIGGGFELRLNAGSEEIQKMESIAEEEESKKRKIARGASKFLGVDIVEESVEEHWEVGEDEGEHQERKEDLFK